jgi:hypothetical protein
MYRSILCIILFQLALACYGQVNQLTDEQDKLSFIKGKWTVDGSETTYIEICDWIQGNHLECVANSTVEKTDNSISYFTYSPSEKVYIYYGLYGGGSSRTLRGHWVNDRFIFEGKRETADRTVRWRVTMKPNADKIDFLEEHSVNNGDWKEAARFQYKPAEKK